MKIGLIILWFILFSGYLGAQTGPSDMEAGSGRQENTGHGDQTMNLSDRILKMSVLSDDYMTRKVIDFDTLFYLPHRYRRAADYSTFNANLGNYGSPFYQISFFDRTDDPDSYLYRYYYPLMHLQSNTIFMDTQVPFTEMKWSNSEPRETSEQTFRIRHTQNINQNLNIGLVYDIIYNLGQYNYQMAEDKTFNLFSSYTGRHYNFYFSAGINNISNEENGGMASTDMNSLKGVDTEDVPMKLSGVNNAESNLRNRNLLIVQKFHLGSNSVADSAGTAVKRSLLTGTISHIMETEGNRRVYSDAAPSSGFYDSIYISGTETFDSLLYRNLKNTVRFDFTANETGTFRLGAGVGIRHEYHLYGQINPTLDTNIADTLSWNHNNIAVIGKVYNNIGDDFGWKVNGELYLSGYRSGDFNLEGEIEKRFEFKKGEATWTVSGGVRSQEPSFWFSHWGSNHFMWDILPLKELRSDLGSAFDYPARSFSVGLNYAIIDNYSYFGSDAMPLQCTDAVSVASLSIAKNLTIWKFHLDSDLLLQLSSKEDILNLPLVSARSALYFEHLFRFQRTGGRLYMEVGAEVTYYSQYNSYSYMPATGVFYNSGNGVTGNYPFVDAFLDFRLKRARIFIMADHVNHGLMGYDYSYVIGYPLNTRMIRYGIAWTFYN